MGGGRKCEGVAGSGKGWQEVGGWQEVRGGWQEVGGCGRKWEGVAGSRGWQEVGGGMNP